MTSICVRDSNSFCLRLAFVIVSKQFFPSPKSQRKLIQAFLKCQKFARHVFDFVTDNLTNCLFFNQFRDSFMSRTSYANEEVSFVCILLLVTYKKCKPTISIMRPVVNFSILSWIVKLKNTFHVGPRGKKYFHGNKLHRSLYICRSICHCGSGWFTWKRSLYYRGKTNSFNAYNDKLHSRKHRRCRCIHSSVLLSWGAVAVCSGPSSKKRLWKFSLQVCHYASNCWCNFVSVWPKFDTDIHRET